MSQQIQRPCDKHQLQSAKLDDFKEVAKEDSVSQALVCTRITWASCENACSDSVALEWGLRFCIFNKLLEDAGPQKIPE